MSYVVPAKVGAMLLRKAISSGGIVNGEPQLVHVFCMKQRQCDTGQVMHNFRTENVVLWLCNNANTTPIVPRT